jgi:hypothetical protein
MYQGKYPSQHISTSEPGKDVVWIDVNEHQHSSCMQNGRARQEGDVEVGSWAARTVGTSVSEADARLGSVFEAWALLLENVEEDT